MPPTATPQAARRLVALSITARLPEAMLGIGLIAHTARLTGSFSLAGLVTATYGLAAGLSGPPLGRLIDRRGPTLVLGLTASLQAALLAGIAVVPAHAAAAVPVLLAAGIGVATPPVGACMRTQLPTLIPNPEGVGRAFRLETSLIELTWIGGPPLVLGLGIVWSTGGALASAGIVVLVSTLAFAAQPISRARKPTNDPERQREGSFQTPAMRTLTLALLGLGVLLGADEVAITAVAKTLSGTTAAAAPMLALWATGSFIGGLFASRFGSSSTKTRSLIAGFVAVAVGHLALIPAAASIGTLAAVLFGAGMAIAPTEAAVYTMVDSAAPAGTITEAFSWLATAMTVGSAGGAAAAGLLAENVGPAAAFALAGGACAAAALLTAIRAPTLSPSASPLSKPATPVSLRCTS